jgi:hypothetical protein
MSEFTHKFSFPVGDWSDDGHGKCEWTTIESNAPVEDWREAYFASVEKLKEHDIAPDSNHGGRRDEGWPLHKMRKVMGYDFPATDYDWDEEKEKATEDIPEIGFPSVEDIVGYTLAFCQVSNPALKYRIVKMPMFPFYGFDDQQRHIGHIGYDLFLD